jgi:CheY-like chemotaxis protein
MDGEIWVESTPGQGSCFCFTASLAVATEPTDLQNLAAAVNLAGTRVLIVDDNRTNRRILSEILSGWGMHALAAAGVPEALSEMRSASEHGEPIKLVLTDMHMPELDGFDLARNIRERPSIAKPVILMLTSGESAGDLARCQELGIAAYLTKPVRRAELRAAITKAMGPPAQPAAQTTAAKRAKNSGRSPVPAVACRILLAEDNPVNQRVALRILEKAGHIVVTAANGGIALQLLEEQSFDVVLMDVQMPEMDGFEATALIREKERRTGARIPIVAMTAHAMQGDRERCLAAGMDDYISKPVPAAALLEMVAAMASPDVGLRAPQEADAPQRS